MSERALTTEISGDIVDLHAKITKLAEEKTATSEDHAVLKTGFAKLQEAFNCLVQAESTQKGATMEGKNVSYGSGCSKGSGCGKNISYN